MIRMGDTDPALLDAWMAKRHQRTQAVASVASHMAPQVAPTPAPAPTSPGGLSGAAGFAAALQGMRKA